MNMNLLHDITFYVMYAAMAIAIFITIERGIYFAYVRRQARALTEVLGAHVHSERDHAGKPEPPRQPAAEHGDARCWHRKPRRVRARTWMM